MVATSRTFPWNRRVFNFPLRAVLLFQFHLAYTKCSSGVIWQLDETSLTGLALMLFFPIHMWKTISYFGEPCIFKTCYRGGKKPYVCLNVFVEHTCRNRFLRAKCGTRSNLMWPVKPNLIFLNCELRLGFAVLNHLSGSWHSQIT